MLPLLVLALTISASKLTGVVSEPSLTPTVPPIPASALVVSRFKVDAAVLLFVLVLIESEAFKLMVVVLKSIGLLFVLSKAPFC